jgi:hypothetical protein
MPHRTLQEAPMSLNPARAGLAGAALAAFPVESPFRAEADAALAGFRSARADLARQVRRGDLTLKIATARATAAAATLRTELAERALGYSATPRVFAERLVAASDARRRLREHGTPEVLQRETVRLLRQNLIEQQLVNRASEFEARAFVRPIHGGAPAPTLDSLLGFHEAAQQAGDDAAAEWARRQLESLRPVLHEPTDVRRVDEATDRPDRINARIVARYVEALRGREDDHLDRFSGEAMGSRDANACAAAYLLAREHPEGLAPQWIRSLVDRLDAFPDAALEALRQWEAEFRQEEARDALAIAEHAAAVAEMEAQLAGVQPAEPAALAREESIRTRPIAEPDQPVGLALKLRGRFEDELPATPAEPGT